MRIEKDILGEVKIDLGNYWGIQTERARHNFNMGSERMPMLVINALALIKKAYLLVCKDWSKEKTNAIIQALDEVIAGKLNKHFPLKIWQSGSGTQTNMNLNEVVANRACEILGFPMGSKKIHPNDDINRFQSTNDLFPSAMHLITAIALKEQLLPAIHLLKNSLQVLVRKWRSILKLGRTHLQDAVPLTFAEEFSGYLEQIDISYKKIKILLKQLSAIPLGGTAVGNGINCPRNIVNQALVSLNCWTKIKFTVAKNRFALIAAHDTLVLVSGTLKTLSTALYKMANDLRWLSSGPVGGIGELILPSNEPGSSIMPGKVNPTQCEALMMIALQVFGNDLTISMANSQGNFELNTFNPLIIYNLRQMIELLTDGTKNFAKLVLAKIKINRTKNEQFLKSTASFAAIFNSLLGYDRMAKAVKYATEKEVSLKKALLDLGYLTKEEYEEHLKQVMGKK